MKSLFISTVIIITYHTHELISPSNNADTYVTERNDTNTYIYITVVG